MARILIVEDDPELRRVMSFALMDTGHTCHQAAHGREAIEVLCRCTSEHELPECVVLDILMPGGVDGWQVLESMRTNPLWTDIPVIVLTGKANLPAEVERARQLRAVHMEKTARFVDHLLVELAKLLGPAGQS